MNKQEATAKISEMLNEITVKYAEIAAIAEEHQIEFYYGNVDDSGGTYIPTPKIPKGIDPDEWEESNEDEYTGWVSSSYGC